MVLDRQVALPGEQLVVDLAGPAAAAQTAPDLAHLLRRTREHLVLHWLVDGFNRRSAPLPGLAQVRNLLGFKDGTANIMSQETAALSRFVWANGPESPAWMRGGFTWHPRWRCRPARWRSPATSCCRSCV